MKTLSTIALFCGAVFLSSCTKEGPAGPAGAQGPQGNANVQSVTFSVSPGDWSPFGTSGQVGFGYAVNRNVSIVTQSIVNTGAVLLYLKAGNDRWVALPVTIAEGTTWNKIWLYSYGVGSVQIEVYDDDQQTSAPNQVTEYKVVAIASSAMITNSGVDVMNYYEVQDYFGLEE
jgi:hypothetical protein